MTSTPVGMRCPECARQRTRVVNPSGSPGRSDAPATYALIGLCVLSFLAQLATGGDLFRGGGSWSADGSLFGPLVAEGEPYRLLTAGFLHGGIIHLGLNMLILYLIGSMLEPAVGTPRFVLIYLVSLVGGSFVAEVIDPLESSVGASGAVFGVMAAAFIIARNRGLDQLASQVGILLVLNLVFTFRPGISVGGHIGGALAGAAAALLIVAVERRRLPQARAIEMGALVALLALVVVGALLAADATLDDYEAAARALTP